MKKVSLHAAFVSGQRGRLLVVARGFGASQHCVLLVPPFAEEMNKSRRMMTELSIALASRGVATLLPDLYGTGDSEGEFADANWETWIKDLRSIFKWAHDAGCQVSGVLGIRLGCALVAQAIERESAVRTSVFWQPVVDGARFITQFLRLRVAASMMSPEGAESIAQLKQRLQQAGKVEIGGYELSSAMASQLESVRLQDSLTGFLGELHWMEVVRQEGGDLQGASRECLVQARTLGISSQTKLVTGEPFWSSTEIVLLPELIERTVEVFAS